MVVFSPVVFRALISKRFQIPGSSTKLDFCLGRPTGRLDTLLLTITLSSWIHGRPNFGKQDLLLRTSHSRMDFGDLNEFVTFMYWLF